VPVNQCGALKNRPALCILVIEVGMSDLAQVDRLFTEINALGKQEKVMLFHRMESLINADSEVGEVPIESVFSIWKDRDITLEKIRQKAWRLN